MSGDHEYETEAHEALKDRVTVLACPFCGNPPKVREEKRGGDLGSWWWVECCKQRSDDCPAICWAGASTKAEVLRRWNTRHGSTKEAGNG